MKSKEKTIGGIRYRMEQVGMETGEQIILRLARPVAALFSGVSSRGLTEATFIQTALSGMGPALGALTGKDLRYVRKALAKKTTVWMPDGMQAPKPYPLADHYDDHFAGRGMDAFLWLKWGIQMNRFFGDVLDRLDAMFTALAEVRGEGSQSSSPTERAGGPTASSSPSPGAQA